MSTVPSAALSQHMAVLGKTGAGKSFMTRAMVERLLDEGRRVCILDYTGVWYGLRSTANGRKGAYPIVIFGGEHADVPLNEHAGPSVAKLVADGNRPCIIDVDGMTVGQQQRFVTAFLEELYRLNTQPLHLVIEETDEFAPQSGAPGTERMLGAVARIFQRGRRKGFRAIAITQRPANLHKRVLTQCNSLVALRLVAPQDRKALAEWIKGHADDETGRAVIDSLPKLPRGEGWVWAPEQNVLERVKFPLIKTFDSMRAPEDGEDLAPASWAKVDLETIRVEMAAAVEEAEANDPKHLKAEIARLKKQLGGGARPAAVAPAALAEAEQRGWERGRRDAIVALRTLTRDAEAASKHIASGADAVRKLLESVAAVAMEPVTSAGVATLPARREQAAVPRPAPRPSADGDGELSGPERALLVALAWWAAIGQARPSRAQVCAIAGWRVTSGHIKNVAGSLRTKGLIDYPSDGRLCMTSAGEAVAEPPPDNGRTVSGYVRETLTGPQAQVFDELLRRPQGLDRESLCEALGWNPTSGHIKNVLGSMRSMEIVEYPTQGSVKLVDWIVEA